MKTYPVTRFRNDRGLRLRKLQQSRVESVSIDELRSQLDVDSVMPGLGREQGAIERGQRRFDQPLGQDLETLATTRFDQRRNQQDVNQTVGFVATRQCMQRHTIGTWLERLVADMVRIELREDLLKMIQLVASQLCQRFLQETMVGI